ncbi:MAG: Ig-like domain-containing protein [Muribaculaceae bacterium]|nr:Ig-like domain-containing protein [Muribaculaceae bacterium]
MNLKKLFLFIGVVFSLIFPVKSYGEQLSIGQTTTVYLDVSLPSGGWLTSADWSTDVVGLNCFNGGTWGTGLRVDGYWSDIATLECSYTYSYYGYDGNIHVGSGTECWFYTCKGYPVSISPTSVTLNKGEKATLTFKISGAKLGTLAARWVSSDTKVASVYADDDYSATVTAKYPGTSVITCYSYMGEPVECLVTVNSFPPTGITVSPTAVEVKEGKTVQLRSTLTPDGASATCTWRTDNSSIATVQNGKVTGVSAGKTKIWVSTNNGLSAFSEVTVISNKPTGVAVSPTQAVIFEGKTVQLKATLTPEDAVATCTWRTDNPSIATVQNGIVTGVSAGKTKIWVSTNNGLSAFSEVSVVARPVSSSLSGAGTEESPYIIASAADLRYLSDKVNSGTTFEGNYFKQTADITINSAPYDSEEFKTQELWIPIGKDINHPFKGVYNGDNHTISGICIVDNPELYDSDNCYGLFGYTYNASILNVRISNSYINSDLKSVAAVINYAEGYSGSISNCHVVNSYIRGINAAGIACLSYRDIYKCSNSATIVGLTYAAGIIRSGNLCKLYNCVNLGAVTAISNTAAGIAQVTNGSIYNCYNGGTISSQNGSVGGIVGSGIKLGSHASPQIKNCTNYGKLITNSSTYGTAGIIYECKRGSCSVKNSYCVNDNKAVGITSNIAISNVKSITEVEMKSTATLEALNKIADEEGYSKWVAGKDGFPVFDWYIDLIESMEEKEPTLHSLGEALEKAALLSNKEYSEPYVIAFEPVITYIGGASNHIAQDGKYSIIYKGDLGLKPGQTVKKGWKARLYNFNGLLELVPVEDAVISGGETGNVPAPVVIRNANEINNSLISAVVLMYNVTFNSDTPSSRTTYTGTVGNQTMIFYNSYSLPSQPAGTYNVLATVGSYNNLQIQPIEFTKPQASVDEIETDDEPVEYFDLKGLPVENPSNGDILIRRKGKKVEKIFVK